MRAALFIAAAALLAAPAHASLDDPRYAECLDLIGENPETAYEEALAWRYQMGGWPAEHCAALSLVAKGEIAAGARRLRANAEGAVTATPMDRAIMLGQAGDAFIQAGDYRQAAAAFSRGLDFAPDDPGLHLGHAEALYADGYYERAEAAASAGIEVIGGHVRLLGLRAASRLELGDLDAAEADLTAARTAAPDDIDLLLLRGRIIETRRTGVTAPRP